MMLEAIRYVDLVIPENEWGQKARDIQEYHADLFCHGDDWEGKFDELKAYCEVVICRAQKAYPRRRSKRIWKS